MGEVAVVGAQPEVAGFALVGARVYQADSPEQVRAAWQGLPASIAVVVLTAVAADVLGVDRTAPQAPLTVVMPR